MTKLSAKELNKLIVNMRTVVRGAVVRIVRKLVAQIRRVKEAKSETKKRRLGRYEKELAAVKKLKKDDVAKFALVNVKTSSAEFNYTSETPAEEIVLYKVATEKSLLEAVDKIRESYPNWHQEIPFYLQRFGMKSKIIKEGNRAKRKLSQPKRTRTDRWREVHVTADADSAVVHEKRPKAAPNKEERNRKSNGAQANAADDDSSLHPSWQIKRQQLEKERLLRTTANTSSRKTFDDDAD